MVLAKSAVVVAPILVAGGLTRKAVVVLTRTAAITPTIGSRETIRLLLAVSIIERPPGKGRDTLVHGYDKFFHQSTVSITASTTLSTK